MRLKADDKFLIMATNCSNVEYFRERAKEALSDGDIVLTIQLLAIYEYASQKVQ